MLGYTIGKKIGFGSFAVVYECYKNGKKYAVKFFKQSLIDDKDQKDLQIHLERELSIVSELDHQNIVKVYHKDDRMD